MSEIVNGLKHIFYIFSHPIDGFWIMKSEKKGNVKSALIIMALLAITMTYRIVGSEYYFQSPQLAQFSFLLLVGAILVLVLLFCIANWALTTLMDGKGKFSEIFMMLMYSLCPVIFANVPLTILTYFFVAEEAAFYTLFSTVSVVWTVFLLFIGSMSIHEYSGFKSILTLVFTVVSMAGIIVLVILAANLVQQVWIWIGDIITELSFRL